MYVRWQSRERNRPQYGPWQGPDIHWSAIIVENMRIDGKPRQLHVPYLAGFTESAINHEAQRCYLWDHISERLDQLANQMTTATRERIEAAVANKVPRPTVAQYKAVARRNARMLGWKYLSKQQQAALADEAERWQKQRGVSLSKLRATVAQLRH